ncbi:hypothetical protein JXB27_02970 [Candidatus Woesearchaeota archaeon]|nr:hypothetical protein [Candidatus Woesearchaeota archaeon]
MQELPEHTIKPNPVRIVLPSFLTTISLGILFYIGIAINVYLLNMRIPGTINFLIFAVMVLLAIIQSLLSYVQTSKTAYLVYKNRIQAGSDYVMFNSVQTISESKNFFDSLFGTGTIKINNLKMKSVPNIEQTFNYIKQLMQYSRTQYNQM